MDWMSAQKLKKKKERGGGGSKSKTNSTNDISADITTNGRKLDPG